MSRDVWDNAAGVQREPKAGAAWVKQGQLTYAQASAFGHGAAFGRSMALVPGQPTCSYERGCDHDHGPHDPFDSPDLPAYATVNDWDNDGWTVQQIPTRTADLDVPVQCIYCCFSGEIATHDCGILHYIQMATHD